MLLALDQAERRVKAGAAAQDAVLAIACAEVIERDVELPLPRLQLEPGRSIVAQAGVAVYRIGTVKRTPARRWLLLDGIVTTILAVVIVAQWPVSSVWALGTLVGIDIFVTGAAAISIGWQTRTQVTT